MSNMSIPIVSVLMSVYNEPLPWLKEAITSVLCQTFQDFEFIIILDNPDSKKHKNFLEKYKNEDKRIILLENKENIGLAASLNKGIQLAKGKYLARMDADDISMPNRLQRQVKCLLSDPSIDICGTWAKRFGDVKFWDIKEYKTPIENEEIRICSVFKSPLIHPTVMGKIEIFKANSYLSTLRKAQDYNLWGRLITQKFRFVNLPEYLLNYRITKKSSLSCVKESQNNIAGKVREKLLLDIYKPTREELDIHQNLCAYKGAQIECAEKWLNKLKKVLFSVYPNTSEYIDELIGELWLANCLLQKISYITYINSSLSYDKSLRVKLKFLKWYLKKI